MLISCMDDLRGLPDAIEAIFPKTTIQLCIVHMIRNSLNYKEFTSYLKAIYRANSEKHVHDQRCKGS
jgi:putative transposase